MKEWRQTRPYGIDYKEDSSKPETYGMRVRLGGRKRDMVKPRGDWNGDCVEMEDGEEVVLSYSGGSTKDSGTIGSGAWHAKGCPLSYSHREYSGTHALSSGRVELLYTLRCLHTTRANGWAGEMHHRLDNEGVVKKCQHLDRGFRATTSSDADLWEVMAEYQAEWRDVTKISWVKASAEKGGAKTNAHERQNKRADEDAEKAHAHTDFPAYRGGVLLII